MSAAKARGPYRVSRRLWPSIIIRLLFTYDHNHKRLFGFLRKKLPTPFLDLTLDPLHFRRDRACDIPLSVERYQNCPNREIRLKRVTNSTRVPLICRGTVQRPDSHSHVADFLSQLAAAD